MPSSRVATISQKRWTISEKTCGVDAQNRMGHRSGDDWATGDFAEQQHKLHPILSARHQRADNPWKSSVGASRVARGSGGIVRTVSLGHGWAVRDHDPLGISRGGSRLRKCHYQHPRHARSLSSRTSPLHATAKFKCRRARRYFPHASSVMKPRICLHCGSTVTTAQLPRRQQQVLSFFIDYVAEYARAPKISEIGHNLGIPRSAAFRAVDALIFMGKINRESGCYTLPTNG